MCEINWSAVEAIGTIITGTALACFAWKQNEINRRAQEIEIALRYQEHYIKITQLKTYFERFGGFVDTLNCKEVISNLDLLNKLFNEADLAFSDNIIKANQILYYYIRNIIDNARIEHNNAQLRNQLNARLRKIEELDAIKYNANYIDEQLIKEYKSHTKILSTQPHNSL